LWILEAELAKGTLKSKRPTLKLRTMIVAKQEVERLNKSILDCAELVLQNNEA